MIEKQRSNMVDGLRNGISLIDAVTDDLAFVRIDDKPETYKLKCAVCGSTANVVVGATPPIKCIVCSTPFRARSLPTPAEHLVEMTRQERRRMALDCLNMAYMLAEAPKDSLYNILCLALLAIADHDDASIRVLYREMREAYDAATK